MPVGRFHGFMNCIPIEKYCVYIAAVNYVPTLTDVPLDTLWTLILTDRRRSGRIRETERQAPVHARETHPYPCRATGNRKRIPR